MPSTQTDTTPLDLNLAETLARNDRLVVFAAVVAIVGLAGTYTVLGVGMNMSALEMTRLANPVGDTMQIGGNMFWTPAYATLIAAMWWAMMIAMMTPSAAPTLLLYIALKRQGKDAAQVSLFGLVFLTGYMLIWAAFSLVATGMQWGLGAVGLISDAMIISASSVSGIVLIGAGFYQFSALKNACLKNCQSPAGFLIAHNRQGKIGALMMGAHHGVYCLGCCWALMALLFVGGIMNLYWIVGLAIYVIVEKMSRRGELIAKIAGTGLVMAGVYLVVGSSLF